MLGLRWTSPRPRPRRSAGFRDRSRRGGCGTGCCWRASNEVTLPASPSAQGQAAAGCRWCVTRSERRRQRDEILRSWCGRRGEENPGAQRLVITIVSTSLLAKSSRGIGTKPTGTSLPLSFRQVGGESAPRGRSGRSSRRRRASNSPRRASRSPAVNRTVRSPSRCTKRGARLAMLLQQVQFRPGRDRHEDLSPRLEPFLSLSSPACRRI
jgi:hypothetical protein